MIGTNILESKVFYLQQNELVVTRFSGEASEWDKVHSTKLRDIIQWEVLLRKKLTEEFLASKFGESVSPTILEVGCGAGKNLETISEGHSKWQLAGVDITPAMVDRCRANPRLAKVRFKVLNVEEAHLDDQFDAIFMLGVVGYFRSNQAAFTEVDAMLKPGGYLIFTFGTAPSISRWFRRLVQKSKSVLRKGSVRAGENHFRCHSFDELRSVMPKTWKVISRENIVFGSGAILGTPAIYFSKLVAPVFGKRDPLRLSLSSFVTVQKDSAA